MTETDQIELLQKENTALRQRLEELERAQLSSDSAVLRAQRLERLYAQAPLAMFETDAELKTRLWNRGAERLFGYRESEMLGREPYSLLLGPRDQAEVLRSWDEFKTAGRKRTLNQATAKDGHKVLCSWAVSYLTDDAGQLVGIACLARDISVEHETERARWESEVLLSATFETAGVGLCVVDEHGHFLRINSAYCQMYGWSRAELVGQHFAIVLPPELRDWATQGYRKMMQSEFAGTMPPVELSVKRRDGSALTVAASYTVVVLEGGRRIQVSAVSDITEHKAQVAERDRRMQDAEREATEKTRLLTELDQKLEVIARQHQQILDLSAPVLDIWEGVLLLPLIGRLDSRRVSVITELLLQAVVERRTRSVILDMTSLELLDAANVGYLSTMVQALRLLGVRSIITGIRSTTAQTMVRMGVDLQGVMTLRDLQHGLRLCLDPAGRG